MSERNSKAVNTTIRKYEQLRVYQVEADGLLKKYAPTTASGQGRLKVYLNEKLNQVYFMIYSSIEQPIKTRQVYDCLSLSELDVELVQTSMQTVAIQFGSNADEDVEPRRRIEFRRLQDKFKTVYHAVEFSTNEAVNDLTHLLAYLLEAYATPQPVDEVEMTTTDNLLNTHLNSDKNNSVNG